MRKMHIDEITDEAFKGLDAPSPDKYSAVKSSFEKVTPYTTRIGVRRTELECKV